MQSVLQPVNCLLPLLEDLRLLLDDTALHAQLFILLLDPAQHAQRSEIELGRIENTQLSLCRLLMDVLITPTPGGWVLDAFNASLPAREVQQGAC